MSTDIIKRWFVIITEPGICPSKKGGWSTQEAAEAFLRDAMLCIDWRRGMDMTLVELTWDDDLWVRSATEVFVEWRVMHPRLDRKAWLAARERHESIYRRPPSMKLGKELDSFRRLTRSG